MDVLVSTAGQLVVGVCALLFVLAGMHLLGLFFAPKDTWEPPETWPRFWMGLALMSAGSLGMIVYVFVLIGLNR